MQATVSASSVAAALDSMQYARRRRQDWTCRGWTCCPRRRPGQLLLIPIAAATCSAPRPGSFRCFSIGACGGASTTRGQVGFPRWLSGGFPLTPTGVSPAIGGGGWQPRTVLAVQSLAGFVLIILLLMVKHVVTRQKSRSLRSARIDAWGKTVFGLDIGGTPTDYEFQGLVSPSELTESSTWPARMSPSK